jgi:hypothetical protein
MKKIKHNAKNAKNLKQLQLVKQVKGRGQKIPAPRTFKNRRDELIEEELDKEIEEI